MKNHVLTTFECAIVIFVISLYFRRARAGRYSHLPLPPGPNRFPLVGNLPVIPPPPEWKTYHKWAQEYNSDIIYLNLAGTKIVVLDTSEAAINLLERRSAIYSSRPHFHMLGDLVGFGASISLLEYGEKWRLQRRVIHQSLHPAAATLFRPYSLSAARKLLNRLLENSDGAMENIRHMAAEVILQVAYGIDIKPKDDPYIKIAERSQEAFAAAAVPGAFLVDSLPVLKYVPEWFPGADFKRKAKEWKQVCLTQREKPYNAARQMRAVGVSKHNFISLSLDNMDDGDVEQEDAIKHAASSMYGAGTDTTLASISSCILGLIENPDVLKKAQEELDRVIKPGYLPEFEDQDSLPYTTAVAMEALRWRDVVPLGLPHYLTAEDEYNGYRIPAGTLVIANSWAMLHDEKVYPNPFTFSPDRFMKDGKLNKEVRDPAHACWGFGRRICPGRYLAFSSMWITLASIMSVFDIRKGIDNDGNVIELTHEYCPGLTHLPKPFKCSITPRSKEAERLIRALANPDFS